MKKRRPRKAEHSTWLLALFDFFVEVSGMHTTIAFPIRTFNVSQRPRANLPWIWMLEKEYEMRQKKSLYAGKSGSAWGFASWRRERKARAALPFQERGQELYPRIQNWVVGHLRAAFHIVRQ